MAEVISGVARLDGGEGGFTLLGPGDHVMSAEKLQTALLIGDEDTSSLVVTTTGRTDCLVQSRWLEVAPPAPEQSWVDVAEISVSRGPVVLTGLTEFEALLTVVAGDEPHRVRISRRTVSDRDELLFEAWPAELAPALVLRRYVAEPDPLELLLDSDEAQRVWTVTRAIGEVVDRGGEELSGLLTSITVVGDVHASGPHALRKFVQSGGGWDGGYSHRGAAKYAVGNLAQASWDGGRSGDGVGGRTASLRQVILELNRNGSARKSWNWVFRGSKPERLFLAEDAEVRLEVIDEVQTDTGRACRLQITHSGIPLEFAAGMEVYWMWQFRLFDVRGLGRT